MLRRTVQSILLSALVASLALASSGCISFNVDTKIAPDGSGSRTIETVLDRSLSDVIKLSGAGSEAAFEKQLRDVLPANATLRTSERDGEPHYVARFRFASIADLNRINRGQSHRRGPGTPQASLRVRRDVFFITYDFSEYLPPLSLPLSVEESEIVKGFAAQYRLTMPGSIRGSNADRPAGGSTAVWSVPLTKGRSVRASSRVVNWPLIAGGSFGLAALAVAIFVIVLAARRRGDEEGATPTGVEP